MGDSTAAGASGASGAVTSAGEELGVFFRPYNWSFGAANLYQNSDDFMVRSVPGTADGDAGEPAFPHMHRFQAATARERSNANCHHCCRWLFDDRNELAAIEPTTWMWYECIASFYECAYRLCLKCHRELSAAHTEAVSVSRIASYPGVGDCELSSDVVRAAILQALTPLLLEPIARIVADFLEAGIRFCSPLCTQPDACEACVRPYCAPVPAGSSLPESVLRASIRGFEHLSDAFSVVRVKGERFPDLNDSALFPALGSADWKWQIKRITDEPANSSTTTGIDVLQPFDGD